MTSRRLFVNAMGEDLRHKIWMAALFVLGNFLALPVAWLMMRNNLESSESLILEKLYHVFDFFTVYVIVFGGMTALPGALITGLAGFRFVFHKRMVDLYHSLPVKRSTLYGVCYVDGILLWFVPFVVCMLSACAMGGSFVYSLGGIQALGHMLQKALLSFLVLTLAYLLVYHMVLVAVMLSGNALNALVSLSLLGFGAVSVYGMALLFFSVYMETFLQNSHMELVGTASPLFSVFYLLYSWGTADIGEGFWKLVLLNGGVTVLLGLWAWLLYRRRASDLAEQGLGSRWMSALLRGGAGILAGMCGWQLMIMTTVDATALGWGIFGAGLAAVVVFGVLDVVFCMEFRAFFAHKFQMGIAVAVTLLCCLAFYGDWLGYDSYLPSRDQVAELALYDVELSNRSQQWAEAAMENMSIRDREKIHAYLEAAVARTGMYPKEYEEEYVQTKVTLENGRSYYRSYPVTREEKEVLWELFTSREYLEQAYCISEEMLKFCIEFSLGRMGRHTSTDVKWEDLLRIVRAYNEDVLGDPQMVLEGRGRLLTQVRLSFWQKGKGYTAYLDVYEGMSRTAEALRQAGFRDWVDVEEEAQVQAVLLPLGYSVGVSATPEEMIELARRRYGVPDSASNLSASGQDAVGSWEQAEGNSNQEEKLPVMYVTDRGEVEELLKVISYMSPYGSSIFQGGCEGIEILGTDGESHTCYILEGMLPEKFVVRFGDL